MIKCGNYFKKILKENFIYFCHIFHKSIVLYKEGGRFMGIQLLRTDSCVSEIISKHADLVYRLCMVYLKRKEDAEDAFQNIFIKLFEKDHDFDDDEHLKAWLIKCTTNHCKNSLKSYWNRFRVSIDDIVISTEDKRQGEVTKYVMKLPVKYKSVMYLYYYEGYSTIEISKILNIKDATVRMRLRRGRERLKKDLNKGGFEHERYEF
jgi:RNA polymerase sigma factor (sigma-70 family)